VRHRRRVAAPFAGGCIAVGQNAFIGPFYASGSAGGSFGSAGGFVVPFRGGGGELDSVSCTGAGDCTAVGSAPPLYVTESGGRWGPLTLYTGGTLLAVSCVGASECTAVGSDNNGQPFAANTSQAPQTITFTSAAPSSAVYSGSSDQTYTAAASATSGLPVTLSIDSSSTSGCTISGVTVSYGSGVGTCMIDANQPGNSSYQAAPQATQSFTVSPALLSIAASSPTLTYGSAPPAITASYSGFVNGDGPGNLTTMPTCSTTATSTSPVGSYPTTCSGASDPDYAISYTQGTVTVTQATPQITWPAPAAIIYGTPLGSAQLDATASAPGIFSYNPAPSTVLQPGNQTLTVTFTPADTTDSDGTCGKITGPVTVSAGGALWVSGGSITGPLRSTGPLALTLCDATVSGPVTISGTTGPVLIGGTDCSGNNITGPVTITGNTGGVSFSGNTVTGPLAITNNSGGFLYSGNNVRGPATVHGNS